MEVTFECKIPPSVNSYLGKRVAYNPISNRNYVQVFETTEAKAFKKYMKKVIEREIFGKGWTKTLQYEYIVCEVIAYFPQKRRDGDNIFKCLLDTFTENGVVYDDSMIMPSITNIYTDEKNPRLIITLRKLDKIGVFKNEEELELFINKNCSICSRMLRNCSILRKSKENRITQDVNIKENKCSKCDEKLREDKA